MCNKYPHIIQDACIHLGWCCNGQGCWWVEVGVGWGGAGVLVGRSWGGVAMGRGVGG